MLLNSSSISLNLPLFHNPAFPWRPPKLLRQTRTHCVSIRPRRKQPPISETSEADELVRVVMRSFNNNKAPLVRTLDKYVKIVRTEHCFLLFEQLGRSDKWIQCLEVFRWMQKQRWYIADTGVFSKLISVMGKKGQTRMAMWLFSEMRNSGCRPDPSVYNALITAHLHSKDKAKALSKALTYFEKMKGTERCQPNVVTYNILLRAFAQARNVEQVNSLFKEIDQNTISPDIYTYNGVMDAYGKNGMIREMENVLAFMRNNKCKPDIITFNLLIDAYGKKQEFDKMEQVYKSLLYTKKTPTLPTFNSMIRNYGKARKIDKAESVFEKLIKMGYAPSFVTYESLITMYGFCDCVSKARDIFDEMVESGKEVKVSSLNAMLDVYCMNGLAMEADLLFEGARGFGVIPDSSTYKLLYKHYTKGNRKELVEKLLKRMDKDGIVPNKKFFQDALGVSRRPRSLDSTDPGSNSPQKNAKSLEKLPVKP